MIKLYTIIGFVLCIGGFIAGIVFAQNTQNYGYSILIWISVFLYALIYFGIAALANNQEKIYAKLNEISGNSPTGDESGDKTERVVPEVVKTLDESTNKKITELSEDMPATDNPKSIDKKGETPFDVIIKSFHRNDK